MMRKERQMEEDKQTNKYIYVLFKINEQTNKCVCYFK